MRLLFCFVGGGGHFEPLAPIARAAVAAGHAVRFACPGGMEEVVRAQGFEAVAVPPHGRPPQRLPLLEPDIERELRDVRERFAAGPSRERAAALGELLGSWRPDVVVHDEGDFGSPVAAGRAGIPSAVVLVTATGTFFAAAGVSVADGVAISPFPPSFRDPRAAAPALSIRLGDAPLADGELVYVTLGTVFNLESGDLFERVLAGLEGRRVVATVGRQIDPASLGPQPAGVRVERYVDQAEVLPDCCAVVSHGGSGSLLGALAHGLPSVLVAMGADQLHNAERAEAVGVARRLHPVTATPDDVAAAVAEVVEQPSYRSAAVGFHEEIAALPGPERAVELLESL